MAIRSVANVYGIDVIKDVIEDQRLSDIACDFYWSLVIDDFPRDDEQDEEGMSEPPGHIELYAQSMVPLLYILCCLLRTGEADLDFDWEHDLSFFSFMYEDYSDEEHVVALEYLQDLASVMYQNYFKMLRIVNLKIQKT